MNTFQFKSHNVKKGLIFGFGYLIVVFILCCLIFGGINVLADAVNNFGSAKGLGILVAVVVIGPLVILLQFINPKIEIQVDKNNLSIKQPKKEDKIIPFEVIHSMEINHSLVNQLQLFDHNGKLLTTIHPQNDMNVIFSIANIIAQHGGFTQKRGTKKIFGNPVETISYFRQ
ncbi:MULTISPECIES: hypothetical protein [Sphingobacterium]|uniref:Uncharacterized protein n=1 Tax=Sphingobacterium siyangense TaxID=459529 RepID=A0A562N0E7_9SPHI|nr:MULTISPECIES: hypothetical protein [Sphingobacterium]TWI25538.1 hypothetical protein IQ31_00103 [Sphingobacterium siyangense]